MQEPLDPAESLKHLVVPAGFDAELFAAEPEIAKPICMTWDHRGRLWIAETVDYPNTKNDRRARAATGSPICEDTDGDGRADKFTVFAEGLSIPTSLALRRRRRDRPPGPRHALPQGHRRRRQGRRPRGPLHRLGHQRHPRRPEQPPLRPGQLDLRDRRLLRLRRRRSAASGTASARGSTASGPTARSWSSSGARTTTPGASASARRACLRLDGQRLPERLPADPEPLLRGGPRLVADGPGDHRRLEPVLPDHREGPPGRLARRLHRRRRPRPLHRPDLPEPVLEPHRLRRRADRPPRRHLHPRARRHRLRRRTTAGTSWPATTSGPPRSSPRSAPTATSGSSTGTTTSSSTTPRPQGFETGKGNAYETPLRDKTHGRIYRIVYDGRPAGRADRPRPDDADGLVAALTNDNMFWRLHAQRLLVERGETDVVAGPDRPDRRPLGRRDRPEPGGDPRPLDPARARGARRRRTPRRRPRRSRPWRTRRPASAGTPSRSCPSEGDDAVAAILDAGLLTDPDPQVRLAALLALADRPESDAGRPGRSPTRSSPAPSTATAGSPTPPPPPPPATPGRSWRRWPSPTLRAARRATLVATDRRPGRRALRPRRPGRRRSAPCSRRSTTATPAVAEAIVAGLGQRLAATTARRSSTRRPSRRWPSLLGTPAGRGPGPARRPGQSLGRRRASTTYTAEIAASLLADRRRRVEARGRPARRRPASSSTFRPDDPDAVGRPARR